MPLTGLAGELDRMMNKQEVWQMTWWERESEFGSVRRSSRHSKRFNIVGGSLIVDGIKPAAC